MRTYDAIMIDYNTRSTYKNTQFESNTHGRNAGSAGAELRGMNINEYIGCLQVLFYNGNDDPAARLDDYVRTGPTDASQTALAQPGHCPVNDIRKGNIETCANWLWLWNHMW